MSTSSAGTFVTFGSQSAFDDGGKAASDGESASTDASDKRRQRQPEPDGAPENELGGVALTGRHNGDVPKLAATSSVAAEAQQGDGPAAASASGSAVGESTVESRAVSVVVGPEGAAAACELGVVVVGPQGAAAASAIGVASAGPHGAAAAGNGANSSSVAIDSDGRVSYATPLDGPADDLEERIARLEAANRELRKLLRSGSGGARRKGGP